MIETVNLADLRADCERVLGFEDRATSVRLWIALPAIRETLRLIDELEAESES